MNTVANWGLDHRESQWLDVCPVDRIPLDRGVCALVGGEQVAVFRVSPDGALYALSNFDPFSKAFVMSRGLVGSKGAIPKVASPIYKQTFDLRTGQCIEVPGVSLRVYSVRLAGDVIQVAPRYGRAAETVGRQTHRVLPVATTGAVAQPDMARTGL